MNATRIEKTSRIALLEAVSHADPESRGWQALASTASKPTLRLRSLILLASVAMLAFGCRSENGTDVANVNLGLPAAAFSQDQSQGTPGLTVSFTNESTGDVDSVFWDFGNGETTSEMNPVVTFDEAGDFTVSLTVTNGRGSSTMTTASAVQVAAVPTAEFMCLPATGFAPFTTTCQDGSDGSGTVVWDFGDGTISTEENPQHTFTSGGTFNVTQTRTTAGGSAFETATIEVFPLEISVSPPSGSPPGQIILSADVGSLSGGLPAWIIDGVLVGTSTTLVTSLGTPGVHTIEFMYGSQDPPLSGSTSIEYVVAFAAAEAGFSPSVAAGPGPLAITFADESVGDIVRWDWSFGDGESCTFPAPDGVPANDPSVCNASAPTHTYDAIGRYDVQLTVTGNGANAGDPTTMDTILVPAAVTVSILDPSFEGQVAGADITAADWMSLRPADATAVADHTTLAQAGGADAGMPTDGNQWAALDGTGTNGSTSVEGVENGIVQSFVRPTDESVIEFDYALLYSEPPASIVLDAMTATVSDGTTIVEIDSARADVSSPFAGPSTRFPTLDGSATRATIVRTASLDLATAFPGADPDAVYTLTIRLTNAVNDFRSPRAYVDNIRFVRPAAPLVAQFALENDRVVVGEDAVFTDETCLDPGTSGCVAPTNYRWDFGTQTAASVPDSSGSAEASPVYRFPEPGTFTVRMLARNADQESEASMLVTVIDAPVAQFDSAFDGATTAPATLDFSDTSTSDPTDPIVSWSWDFAGFGTSAAQNPTGILIPQSGDWLIRLTVVTASGLTNRGEMTITVD